MRQEISDLLAAHPFEPFSVFLSDGSCLDVTHPDQAMLTEGRLYIAKGNEVHRCSLLHITRVAVKETAA
jgi:hypothetical protein